MADKEQKDTPQAQLVGVSSRVNEVEAGDLDPESLDPEYSYRYVYAGGNKIARRLARGYTFVRKSEDGVQKVFDQEGDGADDFIRNGDTVLMKIRKDRLNAMTERIRQVTRARLAAPKGQFRKKAREGGVNVDTKKE